MFCTLPESRLPSNVALAAPVCPMGLAKPTAIRASPAAILGNHSCCCASVPLACSASGAITRLAANGPGTA